MVEAACIGSVSAVAISPNPFTPSHWNFAGFNNYNNPYQAGGLWAGPPFGQYGYGGYGNFAPIVGINNGWFPYEAPWNNNGFGMPGMQGWGGQGWGAPGWGMGMGGNPFMPNNLMFQRVP